MSATNSNVSAAKIKASGTASFPEFSYAGPKLPKVHNNDDMSVKGLVKKYRGDGAERGYVMRF